MLAADPLLYLRDLAHRRAGIVLDEARCYLLEDRLRPLVRRYGMRDLGDLARAASTDENQPLAGQVVEALTTNETSFFRDAQPFELVRKQVLPALVERRRSRRRLRCWSAAASTGQEAYSLAICLDEHDPALNGWEIDILGSDLSAWAIERARHGGYSSFEIQRGLSSKRMLTYFAQVEGEWVAKPAIRKKVSFATHNLLHAAPSGPFDLVMLRNVLLYFDNRTKELVLQNVRRAMAEDGFLVLGSTENLLGLAHPFRAHEAHRGIFKAA